MFRLNCRHQGAYTYIARPYSDKIALYIAAFVLGSFSLMLL